MLIERRAGVEAQFTDEAYEKAGATLVDRGAVFGESDILLKVRAPSLGNGDADKGEVGLIKEGGTVIGRHHKLSRYSRP